MTPLQHLRSMILLLKIFREPNLVILEEAHTTYALIQTLNTQKYTDIDVRKISIQSLFVRNNHSLTSFLHFFPAHTIQSFLLGIHIHIIIQIIKNIN